MHCVAGTKCWHPRRRRQLLGSTPSPGRRTCECALPRVICLASPESPLRCLDGTRCQNFLPGQQKVVIGRLAEPPFDTSTACAGGHSLSELPGSRMKATGRLSRPLTTARHVQGEMDAVLWFAPSRCRLESRCVCCGQWQVGRICQGVDALSNSGHACDLLLYARLSGSSRHYQSRQ